MSYERVQSYPMMWFVDDADRKLFEVVRPPHAPPARLTKAKRLLAGVKQSVARRQCAFWQRLCFLGGFVWLCLFPLLSVATTELKPRGTYFDETTLAPMISRSTVGARFEADFAKAQKAVAAAGSPCDALRFEAATVSRCSAVDGAAYVVVRPRSGAAALEAVALVAADAGSWPFVVAYARHLSEAPWLGKNVVAVLAAGDAGIGCFLKGYVDDRNCTSREMLPAYPGLERGGVLRGAILIKNAANLPAGTARARTHGANGLLPNLDFAHLVNTALSGFHTIDACHGETCADDFATAATPPLQRYRRNLRGLALWVWSLGAQGASGAHAHFLSRGIDAATVDVGAHASAFSQRRVDAPVLASRLEHVLRSLNNVEHDLHHSYFMYLLASPHVFVSIDEMAGAITLMLLPLGLDAFSVLSQIVAEFGYLKMVESAAIEFVGRLAAPLGCGVIVYGLAVRGLLADDASVWLLVFASLAVVHFDARRRRSCWWLSRVGIELFAAYSAIHLILAHTTLALMAASAAAPILAPLRPFRFSSRLAFAARLALWFATSPFPLLVYAPFRNALLAGWVDYGDLRLWYLCLLWLPAHLAAFTLQCTRSEAHLDLDEAPPEASRGARLSRLAAKLRLDHHLD